MGVEEAMNVKLIREIKAKLMMLHDYNSPRSAWSKKYLEGLLNRGSIIEQEFDVLVEWIQQFPTSKCN